VSRSGLVPYGRQGRDASRPCRCSCFGPADSPTPYAGQCHYPGVGSEKLRGVGVTVGGIVGRIKMTLVGVGVDRMKGRGVADGMK
jgi:hypothetical protein